MRWSTFSAASPPARGRGLAQRVVRARAGRAPAAPRRTGTGRAASAAGRRGDVAQDRSAAAAAGPARAGAVDGEAGRLPLGDRGVQRLLGPRRQLVHDRAVVADHLGHALAVQPGRQALEPGCPVSGSPRGRCRGSWPGRRTAAACRRGAARAAARAARRPPPVLAALVVLEHQPARAAVAGEVDAGRPLAGDRLDQVVERAQLGRRQRAELGQRLGEPVALRLVVQPAPLRRRDVDHQLERPGRLAGQHVRADFARGGADQVDPPVADQERAVEAEQLPGERQQRVVAAPDEDERPRAVRDHRPRSRAAAVVVEQQAEQGVAQRTSRGRTARRGRRRSRSPACVSVWNPSRATPKRLSSFQAGRPRGACPAGPLTRSCRRPAPASKTNSWPIVSRRASPSFRSAGRPTICASSRATASRRGRRPEGAWIEQRIGGRSMFSRGSRTTGMIRPVGP